ITPAADLDADRPRVARPPPAPERRRQNEPIPIRSTFPPPNPQTFQTGTSSLPTKAGRRERAEYGGPQMEMIHEPARLANCIHFQQHQPCHKHLRAATIRSRTRSSIDPG